MILDQFGRPMTVRPPREDLDRKIAVTAIRDRWSNYPSSGLTPSKLAAILRAADAGDCYQQAELFEEMEEKDAHLAGLLQTRKLAVTGLDWEILPADETPEAEQAAKFCVEAVAKIKNFEDARFDLLDAISKGYSMCELTWNFQPGRWLIESMDWIHPKKVTFVNSMVPRIITEDNWSGVEVPPFKAVYHRFKSRSGFVTRAGLARTVAWIWLFKNYAVKDWAGFIELFGQPLRLGKYPAGAGDADKQALLAALASLGTDAAAAISEATSIEFVEAAGKTGSSDVYDRFMKWLDSQEAYSILGQTLTSSSGDGSGSFALGKVHSDVRQDLVESDAGALDETLSNQVLGPLVWLNLGDSYPVPYFKTHCEPPEDLAAKAGLYTQVQAMGFPMSEQHIEETFGIPRRKEGETPLVAPLPMAPFAASMRGDMMPPRAPRDSGARVGVVVPHVASAGSSDGGAGAGSPGGGDTPVSENNGVKDDLKAMGSRAQIEAEGPLQDLIAEIGKMVETASSMEDLQTKLLEAGQDLDVSGLAEVMTRARTTADLAGRFKILIENSEERGGSK